MKIYARQINPQYQDSRIFDDDGNGVEYINVWGNRDYQSRTSSVFDRVRECLDVGELADDIKAIMEKSPYAIYGNVTEAINNQLWRDDGKTYGTRQIGKLKQLVLKYSDCNSSEEDQILVDVLSIVTGEKWDYKEIHGCCQGEWNTLKQCISIRDRNGSYMKMIRSRQARRKLTVALTTACHGMMKELKRNWQKRREEMRRTLFFISMRDRKVYLSIM